MKRLLPAVLLLLLPALAQGSGCHPVVVSRTYSPTYGYYNYNYQYTPFLAASYVEQPLYLPTYLVGYSSTAQTQEKLEALEKKLQAVLDRLAPQQPPAAQPPTPQMSAIPEAAPAGPAVLQQALQTCFRCHDSAVAAKAGGGFALFEQGSTRKFTPQEELKILREIRSGHMPPNGKLTAAQKDALSDWVAGILK